MISPGFNHPLRGRGPQRQTRRRRWRRSRDDISRRGASLCAARRRLFRRQARDCGARGFPFAQRAHHGNVSCSGRALDPSRSRRREFAESAGPIRVGPGSIPDGYRPAREQPLDCGRREFCAACEETSITRPRTKGSAVVHDQDGRASILEIGDFDGRAEGQGPMRRGEAGRMKTRSARRLVAGVAGRAGTPFRSSFLLLLRGGRERRREQRPSFSASNNILAGFGGMPALPSPDAATLRRSVAKLRAFLEFRMACCCRSEFHSQHAWARRLTERPGTSQMQVDIGGSRKCMFS